MSQALIAIALAAVIAISLVHTASAQQNQQAKA
jgi:hypothetical protein